MIYLGQDPVGVNSVHSLVIDDNAGNGDTGMTWSADKLTAEFEGKLDASEKGAANGVAGLDVNGKIPSSQLPSYVDDVVEYANLAGFPQTGENGKIYVALDTNKTYRWSGSSYVEISQSLALGETSTTAYRGDRGAAAYAAAVTNVENSPTEDSNNLITSGAVYEGLEAKMDFDPEYGRKVAGVANKLLSDKYTEDNTPYLMRKAFDAEFDEETLVGGTVCWNQHQRIPPESQTITKNGVTLTDNRDGSFSVVATEGATEDTLFVLPYDTYISNSTRTDHVCLFIGCPSGGSTSTYYLRTQYVYENVGDTGNGFMFKRSYSYQYTCSSLAMMVKSGTTIATAITFRPQFFDLTQMFGSTIADYLYSLESSTAGSGVAKLREWGFLRKQYYAYDAGSLQNVQAGSRVIGGFNLLKTQPTNPNNYAAITFNENAVTKVKAGYEYQYSFDISNATSWRTALIIWDLNGNRLEESTADVNAQKAFSTKDAAFYAFNGGTANPVYYVQSANNTAQNMYFTFNQDCYVMFYYGFGDTSASTIVSNVCLNLKGEGDYEPYREPVSYPFDTSLTLRGLPKLDNGRLYYDGDEYKADGTVTRKYGIVDLGTLDWILHSNNANRQAWITTWISSSMKGAPDGDTAINAFATNAYAVSYNASWIPYTISTNTATSSNLIYCVETDKYDSGSAFKTAMSGVYLVYELATPTTESAAPFTPLQEVFPNGTEQFTEWGTRDVEIPVGHKSKYSNNHKTEIDKDISTLYNNKADAIFKSESDVAIANFTDGADGMPVKSMVVDINPVQDLHGQGSPWPAGGNINQFGVDTVTPATGSACYGLTVVTDTTNGTISLSGTPSWTVGGNKQFRLFYQNNSYSKSLKVKYFVVSKSANVTSVYEYPLSADNTDALAININVTDNNELSLVVKPVVYSGNTAPSAWAPTSNICPITGWTAGNVYRTGKNLLDLSSLRGGNFDVAAAFPHGNASTADYTPVVGGQTYTLSIENLPSSSGRYIRWYDVYKNRIGDDINIYSRTWTGVAPSNARYARFMWYKAASYSSIQDAINEHPQFELGSTATTYEPYIGTTYPISWQSEAGTVYGGTVDPINGVLTVTHIGRTFSTFMSYSSTPKLVRLAIDAKHVGNSDVINALANYLPTTYANDIWGLNVNGIASNPSGYLYAKIAGLESEQAYTDYLSQNPLQVVYPLATPITYKLDPATITTLLGTNNIFADTGNISLTYPCDTKAYIDQNEGVKDVQVNGTSVLNQGVANVPLATGNSVGVGKFPGNDYGVSITNDGIVWIKAPVEARIKAGSNAFSPIVPGIQHISTFYGLAKAAGNTDQSESSNVVGVYTDDAKLKIQQMLGLWTPKIYMKYTIDSDILQSINSDNFPFNDTELNIYEELVLCIYQSDTAQTAYGSNDFGYFTIRDAVNSGYINVGNMYLKTTKQCSIMRVKRLPYAVVAELINDGSTYMKAYPRSLDYVDKIRWISASVSNGTFKAGATVEAYIHRFI